MNTPICDFISEYQQKSGIRLHMPGHKGHQFFCAEKYDITEIDGADILYNPSGIIKESEENAASLFGTAKTLYSAEGSSLSVRAMLYLVTIYAKSRGEKPLVLAARNVHSSFISAAVMSDFDIEWIFSDNADNFLSCNISCECLDKKLSNMSKKPTTVYVTSPDYLGNIADIKGLAEICHKHGALFLVDNAHGAYLGFLNSSLHPIYLGADMCCDSAHKTLPVLTGGAYLHISKNAPSFFCQHAENAMSLFATTSPSYLILQSLDFANKYLDEKIRGELSDFLPKIQNLKEKLTDAGYKFVGDEPLKISIYTKKYGYLGTDLANILKKNNIFCEFADPDFLVLMLSPNNTDNDLNKLQKTLLNIEKKSEIKVFPPPLPRPEKICSPREAVMSAKYEADIDNALGKVFASSENACPPGVPVLVGGEKISNDALEVFKYYKIKKCLVKCD